MVWIQNLIYFLLVWFVISLFVIVLAFDMIKLKILLKIKKKKDYGVVVELKDNQSFNISANPINGKNIKIKHRYYNVDSKDVLISDNFNTKGIILSENLRQSINPKTEGFTALDSVSLDNVVKRAVTQGQIDIFELIEKAKKILPLIGFVVVGYMIATIILLVKLNQGAKVI